MLELTGLFQNPVEAGFGSDSVAALGQYRHNLMGRPAFEFFGIGQRHDSVPLFIRQLVGRRELALRLAIGL